jgi:hypothetical protein
MSKPAPWVKDKEAFRKAHAAGNAQARKDRALAEQCWRNEGGTQALRAVITRMRKHAENVRLDIEDVEYRSGYQDAMNDMERERTAFRKRSAARTGGLGPLKPRKKR